MPAYYYHSPAIWMLARDARTRALDVVRANADSPAADAVVAILLAASASEGFINELAEMYIPKRPDSHLAASLINFGTTIQALEKSHTSTLDKYLAGAALLSGGPVDSGKNPYQDFTLLFTVRNAVMHVKPIDQEGPRENDQVTFTMPKFVKTLQQNKLAKPSSKDVGASWYEALQTDRVATWACLSSLNMILAILDLLPKSSSDPACLIGERFRSFKTMI